MQWLDANFEPSAASFSSWCFGLCVAREDDHVYLLFSTIYAQVHPVHNVTGLATQCTSLSCQNFFKMFIAQLLHPLRAGKGHTLSPNFSRNVVGVRFFGVSRTSVLTTL